MKLLCIDIGNTHTHFATLGEDAATIRPRTVPTGDIGRPGTALEEAILALRSAGSGAGLACCSVAPNAEKELFRRLDEWPELPKPFRLTHQNLPGYVRLHYPRPEEIGADRLANTVAAIHEHPGPTIVIDLGTAVTFDIISARHGYEGGIIAPGIGVMTGYLHRQTALLPRLEEPFVSPGNIGKSTREAMTIGCVVGFQGMIEALLSGVANELAGTGETAPTVILTGGTAEFLFLGAAGETKKPAHTLAGFPVRIVPELTLRGLALAFRELNST